MIIPLQLIQGQKSNDATVKTLLDKFDWYILPVANPDGYVYSHTSGVNMHTYKLEL